MKIYVTSVFVDDQQKALEFYTSKLGFKTKVDVPAGDFRWLTVVSPEAENGTELLLEPSEHAAVRPFKQAIKQDGIPFASFEVSDIAAEVGRLESFGVQFTQQAVEAGGVITAILDDTCGNLIQLLQRVES